MKRFLSIIIATIMVITLCACGSNSDSEPTPTAEPTKVPTATPGPTEVPDPKLGTLVYDDLSEDGKIALGAIETIESAYNGYRMAKLNGGDVSEFVTQGKEALALFHQQIGLLSLEEQEALSNYLETIVYENNMDINVFENIITPAPEA